jgi:uncharacterized damage-inducible protein DinB
MIGCVSVQFPSPTITVPSRSEVFAGYLDYIRSRVLAKAMSLPEADLHRSRLPSGWTALELLKHLRYVELRWLEWGFEGRDVGNPWADSRDGRWYVNPGESLEQLAAELTAQGSRSRAVIQSHDLAEIGQPGERWAGAKPATLERVLFHLVQEYARHLGQLDVVTELAGGEVGE